MELASATLLVGHEFSNFRTAVGQLIFMAPWRRDMLGRWSKDGWVGAPPYFIAHTDAYHIITAPGLHVPKVSVRENNGEVSYQPLIEHGSLQVRQDGGHANQVPRVTLWRTRPHKCRRRVFFFRWDVDACEELYTIVSSNCEAQLFESPSRDLPHTCFTHADICHIDGRLAAKKDNHSWARRTVPSLARHMTGSTH